MNGIDIVIIITAFAIVAFAGFYVYKQKKNGNKCIGCPNGASCCSRKCKNSESSCKQ